MENRPTVPIILMMLSDWGWSIVCDGSIVGNGRPNAIAGYGYIILRDGFPVALGGGPLHAPTSNNRAELTAMIVPLAYLIKTHKVKRVKVISDSQYVVNGVSQWLARWIRHGKLDSGEIKNPDLWYQVKGLIKLTNISVSWVRGHEGHPANELADYLANHCRKKIQFLHVNIAQDKLVPLTKSMNNYKILPKKIVDESVQLLLESWGPDSNRYKDFNKFEVSV